MAFSHYKQIDEVVNECGLDYHTQSHLFPQIEPVEPGPMLTFFLNGPAQRAVLQNSEIARRESIIAPFLHEAVSRAEAPTIVFSDAAFHVTEKLSGYPDYILGRGSDPVRIEAPILAIAEAKNYDFVLGAAQCAAAMVAARDFNASKNTPGPVFGCVTNGSIWDFYRMEGAQLRRSAEQFYLNEPGKILAILIAIASSAA